MFSRSPKTFANRRDAGRQLARHLHEYKGRKDVVVLGLPRGGVPVAFEVAQELAVPLDVFIVRKLGAPGQEELAMGAIASGGTLVRNEDVIRHMQISRAAIEEAVLRESEELARREFAYRGDRPPIDVRQQVVILVDDGIATGASMRAAVQALQSSGAQMVLVAIPVAAAQTVTEFNATVAPVVCVQTPEDFFNVGSWYDDFAQTTDKEVSQLLASARSRR